jgi:hypothetical protein
LAVSPRVRAGLLRAGLPDQKLLDWYWACDAATPAAAEARAPPPTPSILLIADLPDPRPESCALQQPAHRKLWAQLTGLVEQAWESPRILDSQRLLARAEHSCGIEIRDPELRDSFLQLLGQVLIPAVALGHVAHVLASLPVALYVVGRGWERVKDARVLASDLFAAPDPSDLDVRACVFAAQRDPLQAALLAAAARGWPLLLHNPGGRALGAALGNVLHPRRHFQPFTDRSELRSCLRTLIQDAATARAQAATTRAHVLRHHTYQQRLQDLLAALPSSAQP